MEDDILFLRRLISRQFLKIQAERSTITILNTEKCFQELFRTASKCLLQNN